MPESFHAAKFAALIAMDRGDMPAAIAAYQECVRLDSDSINVARIWLMLHLALNQLQAAQSGAHEFLALHAATAEDMHLIGEIGVRTNDLVLVRQAIARRGPEKFAPRREIECLRILRLALVDILKERAAS